MQDLEKTIQNVLSELKNLKISETLYQNKITEFKNMEISLVESIAKLKEEQKSLDNTIAKEKTRLLTEIEERLLKVRDAEGVINAKTIELNKKNNEITSLRDSYNNGLKENQQQKNKMDEIIQSYTTKIEKLDNVLQQVK